MSFCNMGPNDFNVKESLPDKVFHSLLNNEKVRCQSQVMRIEKDLFNLPSMCCTDGKGS